MGSALLESRIWPRGLGSVWVRGPEPTTQQGPQVAVSPPWVPKTLVAQDPPCIHPPPPTNGHQQDPCPIPASQGSPSGRSPPCSPPPDLGDTQRSELTPIPVLFPRVPGLELRS